MSHDTETWTPPSPRELKIRVRNHIELYPERHDQRIYFGNKFISEHLSSADRFHPTFAQVREQALTAMPDEPADPFMPVCGTTACVAGWTLVFGENPAAQIRSSWDMTSEHGNRVDPDARARELLDLTPDQGTYLFSASRTRRQVLLYLTALIDDPDAAPPADEGTVTWHVLVMDDQGQVKGNFPVHADSNYSERDVLRAAYYNL